MVGVRAGGCNQASGVYLQPRWWPGFYSSWWTCVAELVVFMESGMKQRDEAMILALLWDGREAGFRFWLCFSLCEFIGVAQACKLLQSQPWIWGENRVLVSQLCLWWKWVYLYPCSAEPLEVRQGPILEHKVVTREMQKIRVNVAQGRGQREKCSALVPWVSSHFPGQTPAGGWSLGHAFGCWDAS